MSHISRVAFEPWVAVYINLMCRMGHSERFKITLSSFVLEHGAKVL